MHHGFACFAHSAENIAIVNESVAEDPKESIPRRSLGIRTVLRGILHLDLYLHPYKVQLMQQRNVVDTWNGYLNNR